MERQVGRPTDYSPEMLARAEAYLQECQDEEVEREGRNADHVVYKIKAKLPTKGGLARFLGVHRDTLYEWAKLHPEFSDVMESLAAEQEDRLINSGLSGDYNPTIAKVLLTKHGYSDKLGLDEETRDALAVRWQGEK